MSAEKVADKCVEAIASEKYDLIVTNFANCDMVGHTGVMAAAVKAVETVDACMGRIVAEVAKHDDVVLVVTADHGNADCMFDETGKVNTAHTTNPVPFAVCEKGLELKNGGKLADIAPTDPAHHGSAATCGNDRRVPDKIILRSTAGRLRQSGG